MSSYFDQKTHEVSELPAQTLLAGTTEIEREMINVIVLVVGDREFPADLREKAMRLIAQWHVGSYAELPPRQEAIDFLLSTHDSELVMSMHSLFHEVASRRIVTRFGWLSDHPLDILHRRDEYDEGAA
jgi:hypothetical protein